MGVGVKIHVGIPILQAPNSSVLTALSSSSSFADRERRRGILLAEAGRVTTTGVSRGDELVDLQRQIGVFTNTQRWQ